MLWEKAYVFPKGDTRMSTIPFLFSLLLQNSIDPWYQKDKIPEIKLLYFFFKYLNSLKKILKSETTIPSQDIQSTNKKIMGNCWMQKKLF